MQSINLEYKILKVLLQYSEYEANKNNLSPLLFEDELRELYEVLVEAHTKYKQDLTTEILLDLWKSKNPVATTANIQQIESVLEEVDNADMFSALIARDLIHAAWKKEAGRKIAEYGVKIVEGKEDAFNRLETFISQNKNGFTPEDIGDFITKDIGELLEVVSNENRWRFTIKALERHVYGPGPGDFVVVYARPETGKTAFSVSLACAPEGFCAQGAKVLYLGNEEDARRTMLRAYMCYSGMTREEISLNPEDAVTKFNEIKDNFDAVFIQDWYIDQVEAFVKRHTPNVLIIDQADKIKLRDDAVTHEKLRELYIRLRALATRLQIAVIAVCQASADGEARTVLTPDMMEGSKTGKYAEGDLIMGIGKQEDNLDGSPNEPRFINVNKNKISGWHGQVLCKLKAGISRYVD